MIYAGFWPRALALLVDLAVWVPLVIVYVAVQGRSIELAMVALLLATGLGVAYPVYFLSRWGQTLGKMVARIKVVRLDGTPIAARHAWLRSSVDIGLAAVESAAGVYVLATWTGPEWSSLDWMERGNALTERSAIAQTCAWASEAWMWSELVVLLLNRKRRALHDFIAGTVVVRVHARSSSDRPRFGTAPPGVTLHERRAAPPRPGAHELRWLDPNTERDAFFHACHAWAASQA